MADLEVESCLYMKIFMIHLLYISLAYPLFLFLSPLATLNFVTINFFYNTNVNMGGEQGIYSKTTSERPSLCPKQYTKDL